jgi:hypothetical protein
VKTENNGGCKETCINTNHYDSGANGICEEKECNNRKVNKSVKENERYCGSGTCYSDFGSDEGSWCVSSCSNTKYVKT